MWGLQAWMQYSRWGLTKDMYSGIINRLSLYAIFLLIKPNIASVCVQQLTTSLWLCTGTLPTPPLTFSTSSQTTCLSLPISPFISSLSLHAKHTNPSSTSPTSLFTFTPHLVHRISFTILTRVQDSTMYMTDPEYRSPHQLFYFIKISLTITSYIYHPRINLLYYKLYIHNITTNNPYKQYNRA